MNAAPSPSPVPRAAPADQATKEKPRIIPSTPSRWSSKPDTTPKGRGIGCLTIVIAYYILGLLIWQGENWKGDTPVVRTYILAPFAWPAAIAGFVPQKELALRIETALACIGVYGWLLRDFITAKTRGILWRSAILLGLLFLLSFCGCWAEFGQDMEGVC